MQQRMNLSHLELCITITAITVVVATIRITQVTMSSLIIKLDELTTHTVSAE